MGVQYLTGFAKNKRNVCQRINIRDEIQKHCR